MAYRAEIQIGVVGVGQLGALQKSLNQVASTVDLLNKKRIDAGFNVQNLNTYNAQLERAWQNINKAAIGSKEELKAVQDLVKAKNNQIAAQERLNVLLAKAAAEERKIVATANAGFGVQGPKAPGARGGSRAGGATSPIGGRADIPGSPAALRATSEAQSKLFENLALGAGFPLLFGGGPGQILGGLLGSFAGPGFGGQILGSAIGGQLEALGVAAAQAGQALQKPIENFGIIEQRAILASSSQEKYVKTLIDSGEFIAANAEIQKRYNEVVGREGSENLVRLSVVSGELNRAWSELNLQLQAALAGPLAGILDWVSGIISAGADANREPQTQQEIFDRLSPEQQQEFKKREQQILQGANLFNEAQKRKEVAELARQFGGGQQTQPAVPNFRATEVQDTAALERRREIQAQITRLRQEEINTAQAQVQIETTILNKQLEFATSLTQQSAIIDKVAAKRVEAANLEYQAVQRTQQTEIINKQIALEGAKAKAEAALAEIKNAEVTGQELLPARKAELQAVIDKVFVAEKDLQVTQQIANQVTQRAQKERESSGAIAEIERRQQQVAAFAADAANQTERFNRASNESLNALNNNVRALDAFTQAQTTINNLEIESLRNKLNQASTEAERIDILDNIRDLEIDNAKLVLQATRTQIAAEVERQRIALAQAEVKFRELEAVVRLAAAQGVLNQQYLDALDAQRSAVVIAQQNLETSIKVAAEQDRAAVAVFNAAVNAANLRANLEGSAAAANSLASAAERFSSASQTGNTFVFGAAGRNRFFNKLFTDAVKELDLESLAPETAQRRFQELQFKFLEIAERFNQSLATEELNRAEEEFRNATTTTVTLRNGLEELNNSASNAAAALNNIAIGPNANPEAAFAAGGYVTRPTRALVAEAGEPEYIIPRSKMTEAMQRYAAGARGEAVIPGGGSTLQPQVNITTGPVMQMNGTSYVTQADLVTATSTAAKQGASMALQMLQNSPKARRGAGVTR